MFACTYQELTCTDYGTINSKPLHVVSVIVNFSTRRAAPDFDSMPGRLDLISTKEVNIVSVIRFSSSNLHHLSVISNSSETIP